MKRKMFLIYVGLHTAFSLLAMIQHGQMAGLILMYGFILIGLTTLLDRWL